MIPIVFPSSLNWFFADQAVQLAADLAKVGWEVVPVASNDHLRLAAFDPDIVLSISFGEAISAARKQDSARALVDSLRRFERRVLLNYDSVFSKWFNEHFVMGDGFFTDLFDITMVRQDVGERVRGATYHWIPEAFTASSLASLVGRSRERPIPWALVGHASRQRAALINALVTDVSPLGFVFSPPLMPYDGSYGLDLDTLRRVLSRTEVYVWGSYHRFPYHEALRAPNAIEAGAAPAKIDPLYAHRSPLPWVYESLDAFKIALSKNGAQRLYDEARTYLTGLGPIGIYLSDALRQVGE